jgi:predicted 2-oxoglutarate/Fe(II)-dependent dioxygenase YbiX
MFYFKESAFTEKQIDDILHLPFDFEEVDPTEDLELTRKIAHRTFHSKIPAWLQNILVYHSDQANKDFNLRVFPNNFGHCSNLTYVRGGYTDWHNDCHFTEMFSPVSRKITIIVATNDPEEYLGGELVINSKSYRLEAMEDEPLPFNGRFPKGSILIFPSPLFHKVNTVTSGVRKTFIAYMNGPTWR